MVVAGGERSTLSLLLFSLVSIVSHGITKSKSIIIQVGLESKMLLLRGLRGRRSVGFKRF